MSSNQLPPGKTEWDRLQEERAAESRSRFSGLMWVGLVLLVVALGAVGLFTFRDALGIFQTPSPTPRQFATPPPPASATPLPTPGLDAWEWVGCEPDAACADALIAREEMASFLARALRLTPITDSDAFTDIASSQYRGEINAVAAAGITVGCTATEFCPSGQVTREQLATFVQRAFHLPATTRDFFTDDEDSPHEAAINALAAAGITTGCGQRLFCPRDAVTRGEVASYLSLALNQ